MKEARKWTLVLTGPNSGPISHFGDTWPHSPAHFERVNVMEILDGAVIPAAPVDPDALTIADYEEVLAEHRELVRRLDVLINGPGGAAKQASLSDMVRQIESEGIMSRHYMPLQDALF